MRVQRLLQQQLSAAFHSWQDRAYELAHKRDTASRALAYLQGRTLGSAFATWVDSVQQAQQAREVNSKALSWWANRSLAAAFGTWQPWAADRRQLRDKLQGQRCLMQQACYRHAHSSDMQPVHEPCRRQRVSMLHCHWLPGASPQRRVHRLCVAMCRAESPRLPVCMLLAA